MYHIYLQEGKRMQYDEKLGESRVRENRTHGLVHGVNVKRLDQVTRRMFTLVEMVVVIVIIAIVVASKVGFFLQFSAIFAFKALWRTINYNKNMVYCIHIS